jgi:tetratricopeptide (TPR) repeat protein
VIRAVPSTRAWAAYAALLVVLSGICFSHVTDLGLDTHDRQMFRTSEAAAQDLTHLWSPPDERENAAGRPAAEAVKLAGYLLWGSDPAAYHLLVVALHTLAAWLLARAAAALGTAPLAAGAAGILFLVNVSHTQAVYHISALDYPLALSAMLATLGAFSACLALPGWGRLAASALGLVVALASHASAMAVLPVCAWLAWRRGALRRMAAPLAGLTVAAVMLTGWLLSTTSRDTSTWRSVGLYDDGLVDVSAGLVRMGLWFLGRLVTAAHALPMDFTQVYTAELALGGVLLAAAAAIVRRGIEPAATWVVWVLASLGPFVLLTEATILEMPAGPSRYLYAASAGVSVLFAEGAGRLLPRFGRYTRAAAAALLIAVVLLSAHELRRARSLFFYSSGRYHVSIGEEETAAAQFRRAVEPGGAEIPLVDTYVRLAAIETSRPEPPVELAAGALQRVPGEPVLQILAAVCAIDGGDADQAAAATSRLQQLIDAQETRRPGSFHLPRVAALFLGNRGLARLRTEEYERALVALTLAVHLNPEHRPAAERLAFAYFQTGHFAASGQLWERLGDRGNARIAYEAALRENPDDATARDRLPSLAD